MEAHRLLNGRREGEAQGDESKSQHLLEDSDALIAISLNAPSVPLTIEILADLLQSTIKNMNVGWIKNLNEFINKLKLYPSEFTFIEHTVYLMDINEYKENQCITLKQRNTAEKLQRLFLYFGFYVACEDLANFARKKFKEENESLESRLTADAARIVQEFQSEYTLENFDPEVLLEKIELLWRVKKALKEKPDEENQTRLGILAERSTSKSCWWFFLGLVFFAAASALVLASHGVAIPYLTRLAELSRPGKTAALTLGMLTSEAGLGVLWWQQKRSPTAFCCFWHRMKEMRAEDEQGKKREGVTKTQQNL